MYSVRVTLPVFFMIPDIDKLFSFLGHSSVKRIKSPFEGTVLPASMIKNPIISNNIIGPSVAVFPTSDTVRSPCDGVIKTISVKKNALVIEVGKAELIINAGLAPEKYPVDFFDLKIREGDSVTTGMPLLSFNLDGLYQIDPGFICVLTVRQVRTMRSFAFSSNKKVFFGTVLFKLNIY